MSQRHEGTVGHPTAVRRTGLAAITALALAAAPAFAQCTQWVPAGGYPGVAGPNEWKYETWVSGLATWDPDGAGPAGARIVAVGSFSRTGTSSANCIATFDPATGDWARLGGYYPPPQFVVALPNGDLFIETNNGMRRWNGTTWSPFPAPGRALALLPNGDLVGGGGFQNLGGVHRWDGANWLLLGASFDGPVRSLVVLPNGDLIAAGAFAHAGGVPAANIARWDGTAWSALGSGTNGAIEILQSGPNGEVFAAGEFTVAGGQAANHVARWDAWGWWPLGSGVNGAVRAMVRTPSGDLVVRGSFTTAGGAPADRFARWDGWNWSVMPGGPDDYYNYVGPTTYSLAVLPNGEVVAGGAGYFPGFDGEETASDPIAPMRWDGSAWRPLGNGIDQEIRALAALPDGCVIAGGDFTQAGAVDANRIARWSGGAWSSLEPGMDARVRALAALPNGEFVAGGDFLTAGWVTANHVAQWIGCGWAPLGLGLNGSVHALLALPGGGLLAGGAFTTAGGAPASRIARWDGRNWWPVGAGLNGLVRALAVLPNGDFVAGGEFTSAGGVPANRIARWDGAAWHPLGSGMDDRVLSLLVLPDGALVVGGGFRIAGGVSAFHLAHWDGAAWSSMGIGMGGTLSGDGVRALALLPDGDLVVADYSFGGWGPGYWPPMSRLMRRVGGTWTDFGFPLGRTSALAVLPHGELAIGGAFTSPGAFFARYVSTCPATATPLGAGCPSSGGANTLAATALPWVDSTFRATGTGLPGSALVAAVTSFTAIPQGVLPLASVFAEGQPGCDLLVTGEIVQGLVAAGGRAELALFLPNVPPLVGLTFFHQMIPIEIGPSGFVAVTATNALQLQAGMF
jgi:hypothetical protein